MRINVAVTVRFTLMARAAMFFAWWAVFLGLADHEAAADMVVKHLKITLRTVQ